MRSRPSGHAAVGSGSAILGAGLLVAGVTRPGPLQGELLQTPLWALAIVGGCVLALAGGLILLFTIRKPEEEAVAVPAHVAFNSRMTIPDAMSAALAATPAPRAVAAAPISTTAQPAAPAPAARLPQPAQPAQGRVPPKVGDIARLDEQIRELTKKINKAGVMLATGQLSQQGYIAYVEDLKRQRAKFEAQRVHAELS